MIPSKPMTSTNARDWKCKIYQNLNQYYCHHPNNNDDTTNERWMNTTKPSDDNAWVQQLQSIPTTTTTMESNTIKNTSDTTTTKRSLGIDIGSMLNPWSKNESDELRMEAQEIITDAVARGMDEMNELRTRMEMDIQDTRQQMKQQSDQLVQIESTKLMQRIDAITDSFLLNTEIARTGTKMAAMADANMQGQGMEVGVWGTMENMAIPVTTQMPRIGGGIIQQGLTTTTTTSSSLTEQQQQPSPPPMKKEQRILVLADVQNDNYAKLLVPALQESLKKVLAPGPEDPENTFEMIVYAPTATVPMGGANADAVLLFCTSYTNPTSVVNVFERIMRRTIQFPQLPSQWVVITTIGTSRVNQMPYSMQNMMNGGKLSQRQQMEESLIKLSRSTSNTVIPVDCTICKLGEIKSRDSTTMIAQPFQLAAGDTLDGMIDVATAVTVLTQAIALQPIARNITLSCVGHWPIPTIDNQPINNNNDSDGNQQDLLDDAFLRLDGPELLRFSLAGYNVEYFGQLVEYLWEWADMWATSGQGLTTPIQAIHNKGIVGTPSALVQRQASIQMIFLPTATGFNYVGRAEERDQQQREKSSASSDPPMQQSQRSLSMDGGVEFVVEILANNDWRVRVKRCRYGNDTIIKELSEETILARFRKCMEVWKKEHMTPN